MPIGTCVNSQAERVPKSLGEERVVRQGPSKTKPVLVLVTLLALLQAFPATAYSLAVTRAKHLVTLNDLLGLKGGDMNPRMSPDGRWLAYIVRKRIWLVATKPGGSPHEIMRGWLPRWSPQSTRVAYYSNKSGRLQLWVYDLRTHHAEQITRLAKGINPDPWTRVLGYFKDAFRYSWSPDGRRLVFPSRVWPARPRASARQGQPVAPAKTRKSAEPLILTNTTPPDWTLSGVFAHGFGAFGWKNGEARFGLKPRLRQAPVNQLFVADLRTKALRQLTTGRAGCFDPEWSPNGRWIFCASSDGRSLAEDAPVPTNIYRINVRDGSRLRVTKGSDQKYMPLLSPNGKWLAYFEKKGFSFRYVFVMSATGGPAKPIPPLDRFILDFQWGPESKSLLLISRDGVTAPVTRVSIASGAVTMLSGSHSATRRSLTASRSGSVAWQQDGPYSTGVIRIGRLGDGATRTLIDVNPQIQRWKLGKQEVFHWKDSEGEQMQGLLLLPVGYKKGHLYPLIVDAYPMQEDNLKGAMSGNQAWASRGYVVFWPDATAPHVWMNSFTTERFSAAAKGPGGWQVTRDEIMSGVDALIRRRIVDPDRMGLYGFSNGGGIVNYLVTQTNRFKCAVSVAGAVSDWLRLATLGNATVFMKQLEGGADPWSDPWPFVQLSAVFRLKRVRTPMLLADGDDDGEFLLNTIEMYNGLRWLGKSVTLLRYPDQQHGFTGAALRDFWRREQAFFDKYLKPTRPSPD